MKKFTLILMLLLSIRSFAQLPLQDFEGTWTPLTGTSGPAGPDGWYIRNERGPIQKWGQVNSAVQPVHSGSNAAYINRENIVDGTTTEDWLITPAFNVPNNAQLKFWSRLTIDGDQSTTYKIFIGSDPADISTFTEIQTWTELEINPVQTDYTEKLINIPATYTNQSLYIAFVMQGDNGDRWLVDDVQVVEQCFAPTSLAANPSGTFATLSWTGSSAGYEVEVVPFNTTPTGIGTQVSAATFTTPATLTPSTAYSFYVRSVCSGSNTSAWAGPFNFSTTQIPANLNYTEGFETPPSQWTIVNGTQTNQWYIGAPGGNASANGLYISNTAGTTNAYSTSAGSVVHAYRDIFIPANAEQANLSFDWRNYGESNYDYIRVWLAPASYTPAAGTQSTTANSGGVQIGGNFQLNGNWSTSNNTVNVAPYAGTVRRLIFEWRNDTSAGTQPPASVDNINLSLITCPAPTNLALASVNQNSANITWTGPTSVSPTYDFYFSTSNTAPTASTSPTANVPTAALPLNSLSPLTTYYVWVRSNCGSGDTSTWTGPLQFSTTQVPATLNYSQDFEGTPNFAFTTIGSNANKWVVGTAVANGGTHSLYVTNDNGTTNAYAGVTGTVVHAFRDILVPAGTNELGITFDWKGTGENNWDYMRVWVIPTTYTPVGGTQITTGNSGGTQVGGNFGLNNTWTNYSNSFNATAFAGRVCRVVFEWTNDGSVTNQPPAAVDNVNISVVTCPRPSALAATPSATSASLSWTPGGTETQWEVYVTPTAGAVAPTASTIGTQANTNTNFVYGPLNPTTAYQYYVRAVCSSTDKSLWVGPFAFTTTIVNDNCTGALPLTVNATEACGVSTPGAFTGATVSATPACSGVNGPDVWYQFTATNSSQIISLSNFNVTGTTAQAVTLSVYSNACDNLNLIGCSIANYIKVRDLTPGETYLVRLTLNSASPNLGTTFNICASTPPPPVNNNQTECAISTINYSFEDPAPGTSLYPNMVSDNTVQGWRTTANDHIMEFWPVPNYQNIPSYNGNQFIELNANANQGTMGVYQDFATPSPITFTVKFAHRGRMGTDTMQLLAGDASQPISTYTQVGNRTFSTGNTAWAYYGGDNSITYTVPAGQTVTRFFFQAVSTSTGDTSVGNYLDAISFTADNSILTTNPATASCLNNVVSVNALGDGVWQAHSDNPATTVIANPNQNATTITGFTTPGVYQYEWVTSYCSSTLTVNYTAPAIALPTTPQDAFIYCAGETPVTLSATADAGYTLHWYDAAAGGNELASAPTPSTATVGTVMYYASQSNGTCEGPRLPFTITVNPVPNAPTSSNVAYCQTATATPLTATADAGNALHWYTTATGGTQLGAAPTPDTSVVGTTNYYVSQTSPEGCESPRTTITVTVTAPATQPTEFTLATQICIAGTNPQAVLNAGTATGGTFASSDPTRLVIDPATGIIDLATSTPGAYDVTYTLPADVANCLAQSYTQHRIVITPLAAPVVSFSYATVCESSANILPVKDTGFTNGGTFTSNDPALVVNATTGEIQVSASTPGSYTVTYTVPLDAVNCVNAGTSMPVAVTINRLATPNTTYSYPAVCGLETTLNPVKDAAFATGGTFSTTDTRLDIDPVTGIINVANSQPGTYNVMYTLAQNDTTCTAGAVTPAVVTITTPTTPITGFTYANAGVCSNATGTLTAAPNSGFTAGGMFSATPAGLNINATTGEITIAGSAAGAYDIVYTVPSNVANCTAAGVSPAVRFTITPAVTPEVGFSYEANYCYGTGTISPVTNPGFNTTGTFTVTGGLTINPTTGQLSLANATPGSYTVTYTVAADPASCTLANNRPFTFTLAGEIEFAVDGACEGPSFIINTTPVNNSFDAATASYEWTTASGVTVGDNSENFNVSQYLASVNNPVYPMVFNVTVTVGNCTKTLPYTVDGITCQIQRGISPGGTEGLNDNFDLSGFGVKKLSIFNRYGKEVYSKTNYVNEWHGQTSNGDELPTGTYFYMIDSESAGQKTGWIYINRQQ